MGKHQTHFDKLISYTFQYSMCLFCNLDATLLYTRMQGARHMQVFVNSGVQVKNRDGHLSTNPCPFASSPTCFHQRTHMQSSS